MQEIITVKRPRLRLSALEPSEQDIQNEILQYLSHLHGCFAWRNNSVGVWDQQRQCYRKNNSRWAMRGVSDILGVFEGRLLAIEVKRRTGRVSPEQQEFIDRVLEYGGIAFVARSVADVRSHLGTR